ncbi:MAG: hypothetical protein NTX49_07215 [Chlamydiae bacterium]|nr:hypothetical protein [Chlamydiota bacterium]
MGKKNLFIGRKQELKELKLLLSKKTAALVVIKGRRRIGKSRLIEEFAKGKNFLRFEGVAPTRQTTAQAQRAEFARQIQQQLGIPGLQSLKDWGDLFTIVAETTKNKEIVILFDEITWMGSKDAVFLGKLKIVWEQHVLSSAVRCLHGLKRTLFAVRVFLGEFRLSLALGSSLYPSAIPY